MGTSLVMCEWGACAQFMSVSCCSFQFQHIALHSGYVTLAAVIGNDRWTVRADASSNSIGLEARSGNSSRLTSECIPLTVYCPRQWPLSHTLRRSQLFLCASHAMMLLSAQLDLIAVQLQSVQCHPPVDILDAFADSKWPIAETLRISRQGQGLWGNDFKHLDYVENEQNATINLW